MNPFQDITILQGIIFSLLGGLVIETGIKMYGINYLNWHKPKFIWEIFFAGSIILYILIKLNLGYIFFSIYGIGGVLFWSGFIKWFTIEFFGESNKIVTYHTILYIALFILFLIIFKN